MVNKELSLYRAILAMSDMWSLGYFTEGSDLRQGYVNNNYFTEMCSGSEAGSYLRLMCITQL